ncbi:hypothetical protein F5146DRAFT_23580 [Armillaria mellea]|nr:hypothetical protein F5146DRAFT_23580 [Armillaria mellea]
MCNVLYFTSFFVVVILLFIFTQYFHIPSTTQDVFIVQSFLFFWMGVLFLREFLWE